MNTKLNKSDIILISIYFLVNFMLQTEDYYRRNALLREYLLDFPVELISICSIIYLFIFWLIPKVIAEKKYLTFSIYGISILIFFAGIDHLVGFWSGNNDWSKFPKGINYVFSMIDKATSASAFPFALLLTKKFYEGKTELAKVEKQQKENELKLLRSQLDPHFLFNNLNTLDSLIDSNPIKAKEYLNKLSQIYRYLIRTKDAEVVELTNELEFAENYIFLIQTRFGNDYNFSISKKAAIDDKFIPTGAIQTLLENVVKHNKVRDKTIETSIIITEKRLEVSNQKSTINHQKESFGTGLKNLKTRYQLLTDEEINIINTLENFKVTIPIINLDA